MAKLTVKYVLTGGEYDIELDLDHTSVDQLIIEFITKGFLKPERELPCDYFNRYSFYTVLDNNNHIIYTTDLTFSELGFIEGDTIRIIIANPITRTKVIVKNCITNENFKVYGVDLNYFTPRLLIKAMIFEGFLNPECQLPSYSETHYSVYGIMDRSNTTVLFNSNKSFSQLGFKDGDTIRIVNIHIDLSSLTVRFIDGTECDIENLDLDHTTVEQLITMLVNEGLLETEEDYLIRTGLKYAITDKNNCLVKNNKQSLSELGFKNNDIIRVITHGDGKKNWAIRRFNT